MPINPSGYYSGGAQGERGRSARDRCTSTPSKHN